jgi:uncharacterized protein (DUF2141 family)
LTLEKTIMKTLTSISAAALMAVAVLQPLSTHAADVVVRVTVTGAKPAAGEVACSLFSAARGFPMDVSGAQSFWQPAASEVTCRFTGVADGTYALAVAQDLNGNRRIDTNAFGAPTEPWGVSNNIRHTFSAPKFDEAKFRVADGQNVELQVRIAP